MSTTEYEKALRLGRGAYRASASRGKYPFLPALDEMTQQVDILTEESLGLVDIPLDQIVGTKTSGRKVSFAGNFMPLMPENSEFARKWENVYEYHMEQGVGDPIVAYEYLNRFYVLEGNKRVSVLKYVHADSIEGMVTRIIPQRSQERENRIYFEFLRFYKATHINYIFFTKEGSFEKLQEAVGRGPDEAWTDEDRTDFKSLYTRFTEIFDKKGGRSLPVTPGDALLFYLSLYPYRDLLDKSQSALEEDITRIWPEIAQLSEAPEKALVLEPTESAEGGSIFSRFFRTTSSKVLKVAFIHDKGAEESGWTYSHELGRMALDQIFGDKIHTESVFCRKESADISELLEEAIAAGNHVIFTTNQRFLGASLKAALEHPEVKILNCSVNQPYRAIRTYFGRLYEAKFLGGMIAGAMCENDKIAYMAQYPIYGSIANINAFTLGAKMTNPRARVYLHWNSQKGASLEKLLQDEHITLISDNDMIRPASESRQFGLYLQRDGNYMKLAAPIWNWGRFYEKIIRDLLQGSWDKTEEVRRHAAVSYWWGMSSGILDLIMSKNLPTGITALTNLVRRQIYTENFYPFYGEMTIQGGYTRGTAGKLLTPEEIITMDYLVSGVEGGIPPIEELTDEARELIEMQKGLLPVPAAGKSES